MQGEFLFWIIHVQGDCCYQFGCLPGVFKTRSSVLSLKFICLSWDMWKISNQTLAAWLHIKIVLVCYRPDTTFRTQGEQKLLNLVKEIPHFPLNQTWLRVCKTGISLVDFCLFSPQPDWRLCLICSDNSTWFYRYYQLNWGISPPNCFHIILVTGSAIIKSR